MTEHELNIRKRATDELARQLAGIDSIDLRNEAKKVATSIKGERPRIVITGAAGSMKTSFSEELSKILSLPVFDLDERIPAGDTKYYQKRFYDGLYHLWNELPSTTGWIIEHVHACAPDVLRVLQPSYAIYLHPPEEQVKAVAHARERVTSSSYLERAMETWESVRREWDNMLGATLFDTRYWSLKRLG
jgi:hypothetical protein